MQRFCSSTVDRSVATLFANYAAPSLRCGLRRLCYLPHRHAQTCTEMHTHTHTHTCTSTNEHALTLVIPPRWIWQPQSVSVSCPLQQLQLAARHKQTHTHPHTCTHTCVCAWHVELLGWLVLMRLEFCRVRLLWEKLKISSGPQVVSRICIKRMQPARKRGEEKER